MMWKIGYNLFIKLNYNQKRKMVKLKGFRGFTLAEVLIICTKNI